MKYVVFKRQCDATRINWSNYPQMPRSRLNVLNDIFRLCLVLYRTCSLYLSQSDLGISMLVHIIYLNVMLLLLYIERPQRSIFVVHHVNTIIKLSCLLNTANACTVDFKLWCLAESWLPNQAGFFDEVSSTTCNVECVLLSQRYLIKPTGNMLRNSRALNGFVGL